jgi:hypothetical protein
LQEFHSCEIEIDFSFALGCKNLRVVNLACNGSYNNRGLVQVLTRHGFRKTIKRQVINLDLLEACLVLSLCDSYVDKFENINENVLALNLKNSNFDNLETISKLINLQYLDISDTKLNSLKGIEKFKQLRVLNCCNMEFDGTQKMKKDFFTHIYWFNSLELIVMDSKLFEEYKLMLNILPSEKIVVLSDCNFSSVNLSTYDIIKHFKISEQILGKVNLAELDFEPIKKIFENFTFGNFKK